jgi:predicted anti-sigma-YlaC factor YlaD
MAHGDETPRSATARAITCGMASSVIQRNTSAVSPALRQQIEIGQGLGQHRQAAQRRDRGQEGPKELAEHVSLKKGHGP